ncbi:MAG TPA: aminotransferase class V-fold PLP-dependent enzyme [Terriglobales bacterium]|nr:aminotransferase class V-fold PLP-dependent enzyme [Terriglobales bacterium]
MLPLFQVRELFPLVHRCIYLNNASQAPIATPTRAAIETAAAELNQIGPPLDWTATLGALEASRQRIADLVHAGSGIDIAFVKNTSEGLATVAQGLDWRSGDRVVSFACEFPANLYPWLELRSRGVQVELLPEAALANPDRIRAACRGAKLLTVSFVQFLSGFRSDLDALGAVCRETGTWFVVDGIQGLGAFPVDVQRAGIHALAADGHKWLTAPEGAGLLYIAPEMLEHLRPPEIGWLSVAAWDDLTASHRSALAGELIWRAGAARLECGTLNMIGIAGLDAAVNLLQQVGVDAIAAHVLTLGEQLRSGLLAQGCELLRPADPQSRRSGITSFRHPGVPAETLVSRLGEAKIICANRDGWVRCSPHLYNNAEDISSLLAIVQGVQ